MKKILTLIVAVLFCQISFAQLDKPQKPPCSPPVFKKGQTSAEVNADTRAYIDCVKNYKKTHHAEKQNRKGLRNDNRMRRQNKENDIRNNAPEVQGK